MTQILCLGLNHSTAPIELREKLYFSSEQIASALATFRLPQTEFVLLATCNRLEFYLASQESADLVTPLIAWLADFHHLPATEFAAALYQHTDLAAVSHLCHVAAGLNSMVLGEPQILGQINKAFTQAQQAHTTGPILNAVFQTAVRVGKRVRHETSISHNPASISSVAVQMAQTAVPHLLTAPILVIGAGEMAQLSLKALHQRGATNLHLLNRTAQRAQETAVRWGGTPHTWDELPTLLHQAEIIITATGATEPILTTTLLQEALLQRTTPLLIIDIALPRDVAAEAAVLPGLTLYDLDTLQQKLQIALNGRHSQIPRAQAIIAQEQEAFAQQLRQLAVRPLLVDLRQMAETVRQQELARVRHHLPADMPPEVWEQLNLFSHSLVNKLLHHPTLRLKESASQDQAEATAQTLRDLFNLSAHA